MPAKIITAFTTFILLLISLPALAAPQILGLVATASPIPLMCREGVCKVEITTVCLQEFRHAPMQGRAYKPGKGTEITINIKSADGRLKSVPVNEKISIAAHRHYTTVVISLPEKTLRQIGHANLSDAATISVSAMASAVPVPDATDKIPLTAFEIEKYTGPLRQVARGVFDRDSINVATTRHLNQVINRLPDDFTNDEAQFERSWADVSKDKSRKMLPEVSRATSKIAETCRYEYKVGKYMTLRSCLEQTHDVLASDTNKKVWQAMKPGG